LLETSVNFDEPGAVDPHVLFELFCKIRLHGRSLIGRRREHRLDIPAQNDSGICANLAASCFFVRARARFVERRILA